MRKSGLLVNTLMVFGAFWAGGVAAAPEYTSLAKITLVNTFDRSGNVYVDLVAAGCSFKRYILEYENAGSPPVKYKNFDSALSVILTGYASGADVRFRFDGCNGQSQGKIIGVEIKE